MLWGPMARQALDEPYNGEGFESVMRQVAIFVEHLLEVKLSRGTRTKLFRAFGDLLKLADKRRQYHLLAAVQPLTKHPLFPIEVLPHWATAHASGTWKQVEPPPLSLVKADAGSGAIDWEGELPSLFDLSLTPDEPE